MLEHFCVNLGRGVKLMENCSRDQGYSKNTLFGSVSYFLAEKQKCVGESLFFPGGEGEEIKNKTKTKEARKNKGGMTRVKEQGKT